MFLPREIVFILEQTRTMKMAMAVGAVGKDGLDATYSTPGASLFVAAPGGDVTNSVSNIITASINGGCTDSGQGTAFAAVTLERSHH
jgi:hypothetical protein